MTTSTTDSSIPEGEKGGPSPEPSIEPASDDYIDYLWGRRKKAIYRIRVSVLYHLKLERYYDTVDKLTTSLTALSATFAVGLLLKEAGPKWELSVSVATAVLSLIPLVYNPAEKTRKHGHAAAEFRRLLAECEKSGERWKEQECDKYAGKIVELEVGEPAPLCALMAYCENQLNIATDKPRVHLRLHERWLKYWIAFDAAAIKERSDRINEERAAQAAKVSSRGSSQALMGDLAGESTVRKSPYT
jgi:hypothetical protein